MPHLGRGHLDVARAAIQAGANAVQLRDKGLGAGEMCELARAMADLCRTAGVPLLVNDRLDVALAAGADGVHLGQEDLPALQARRLLGPARILGVSAANAGEARRAEADGADYVGVGPAFPTATKADAGAALGPSALTPVARAVSIPVVAIGGIDADNAGLCIAAGAAGVAVISAVAAAPDMADAARRLAAAVARATATARRITTNEGVGA